MDSAIRPKGNKAMAGRAAGKVCGACGAWVFIIRDQMKKTAKPKDVEAYIAAAPKEVRAKLKELRAIIRKAAPAAEEKLSYGMPYYAYHGRLAYFGIWKTHIGLYIPTPVMKEHEKELSGYETSGATVRLPLGKKLPAALIRKLVKARMIKNEARKKK